jgi:hypothetical protein
MERWGSAARIPINPSFHRFLCHFTLLEGGGPVVVSIARRKRGTGGRSLLLESDGRALTFRATGRFQLNYIPCRIARFVKLSCNGGWRQVAR